MVERVLETLRGPQGPPEPSLTVPVCPGSQGPGPSPVGVRWFRFPVPANLRS